MSIFNFQFSIFNYLQFLFSARNTRGHGVHSPYVFDFVETTVNEKNNFYCFEKIEMLRKTLLRNKKTVNIVDFGTGKNRVEKICDIARRSLKPSEQAQLLFRIINFLGAKNVLELGTSLGVTTAYLASSSNAIRCITMEGSAEIAKTAAENFEKLKLKNIEIVVGNIDETLDKTLEKFDKIDFVFLDANHRREAMVNYFEKIQPHLSENAIVAIDDIRWSKGMFAAWKYVKNNATVTSTIDFFDMGIAFFNKNLSKKHYKIKC